MINDRYIIDYANSRIDILEKTNTHLKISYHDWEDFRQETLIHIFQKKSQWLAGNGYKGWIRVIIRNQFLNYLRHRFNWTSKANKRKFKLNIRNPDPFLTKIVEIDSVGNKHWDIFPDMIEDKENEDLKEIISELDDNSKKMVETYIEEKSWKSVAKILGIKGKNLDQAGQIAHSKGRKILQDIKQRF